MAREDREKLLLWGWLRMVLGAVQMAASVAAVVVLFRDGLGPVAWILVGVACAATLLSRFLYRGFDGPPRHGEARVDAPREPDALRK